MANSTKSSLIIGTATATNGLLSGAALRVAYLETILIESGFDTKIVSLQEAKAALKQPFDLIVICSYSCARIARLARKKTPILWFDPYDSWTIHRFRFICKFGIKHLAALARDLFYLMKFPRIEILSFISRADLNKHLGFGISANKFVLPIHFQPVAVSYSSQSRFVFVGDGKYPPNQKAVQFLDKLGRSIGEKILIIGRGYKNQNSFKHCEFAGYQSEDAIYKANDIHLAPIEGGAGIKTKVALPLYLGLRVIASPQAANGMRDSKNLWIAENINKYTEALMVWKGDQMWRYGGLNREVYIEDQLDNLKSILDKLTS